ncbi:MAG: phospholipase D family protein [Pseudomonadota bacterium]|nr:phospholipase D family protein [Pseudomonadota bacterium]
MRPVPMRQAVLRALALCALLTAAGCASLPSGADLPKTASHALGPIDTRLRRTFEPLAEAHPGTSGFRMLSAGIDGLTARVELIDSAERTLDLQYYIFHRDTSGNLIALALLRAADRGVRVRLLVDDGETRPGDEDILSLTARPGIEVRIFNPLTYRGHNRAIRLGDVLLHKHRLDYRMHNKLMVADDAVAIIGGRNIGDQYFQIDPQSQFGDDDVVVAGPMVENLSNVFDEFWNSRLAVPAQHVDKPHTSDRASEKYLALLAEYRRRLDAAHPPPAAARRDAVLNVAPRDAAVDVSHRDTALNVARHDAAVNVSHRDAALQVAHREEPSAPIAAPKTPFADIVSGRVPLLWEHAQLAYDSPDKKAVENGAATGSLIYASLAEQAKSVHSELLMVTPYLIPSPDELAILEDDRRRNVMVRILTNSLESAPDLPAHAGYVHYREGLLRDGVELHEVRAQLGSARGSGQTKAVSRRANYALHGKLYVFDRKRVFIGSMNFDERSKHLNTEIGLLIASPELSREVAVRFDALTQLDNAYLLSLDDDSTDKHPRLVWITRESGSVVQYKTEPTRNAWQRVKVKLLSMLPLDKEL